MYNDTIKVANKIISDKDLLDIFQRMNEEIIKNIHICKQEEIQNEKFEIGYQNWTSKEFDGSFKCTFDFYDDTNITVDNYNTFLVTFNNRLHEIKDMWVRYNFSYWIVQGRDMKLINQHIYMNIYEYKMDIDVSLSSVDNKMEDIYQMIKDKIIQAPERYDRIIKKKNSITNKIGFAVGFIPSIIIFSLLSFIPIVRQIYCMTYVLFPVVVSLFSFVIGNTIYNGKLDHLYSTIVPEQKYAGYDFTNNKSIYKDDIDKFINTSEIIIGKNIDNLKNRQEIIEIEKKYKKYIPKELLVLLVLSIFIVLISIFIK